MRIIDSHVHLCPPEACADPAGWAAARGEAHWAALCARRRRSGRPVQGFPSLDGLLRAMDESGVARAVLLGWYWEKPATCSWQNRWFAQCVKAHPDRLAAFATFHPAAGEAAVCGELLRSLDEGLCGLGELSPHSQGVAADDPALSAALDIAAQWRLPVNFHVTDPEMRPYPGLVETPLEDFARLARAHAGATFILAHWGGGEARRAKPIFGGLPNVFYDTAASPLTYDAGIWKAAMDTVGPDRILFGSDYPLDLYPKSPEGPGWSALLAEIGASGLAAGQREALLGGNARRLFGWGW